MPFETRRALVTGGTSGIGRALCVQLAAAGASVLACGTNPRRIHALSSRNLRAISCDVAEPEDVRALAVAVDTYLGGLDILINCAGIQRTIDITDGLDMSEVEREVSVNLLAPMRVTDALLPVLLASGNAAIVNITSILASAPKERAPVYCAAKAGLASWTTSLRYQLESHGVHVMELVPPVVQTRMTEGRNDGAISADVVAEACLAGLAQKRARVTVGKARFAALLQRLAPTLLARKVRHA